MFLNRWQARIPAALAALVAVLGVVQGARAELIPTPTTVTGTGPFTFSYDFKVLGTSQVQTGDFAVIYDVKGYIPGSATAPGLPGKPNAAAPPAAAPAAPRGPQRIY